MMEIQIKSCTIQNVALQILRLLPEDAHLETKHRYEGEAESERVEQGEAEQNERQLGSSFPERVEKIARQAGISIGVERLKRSDDMP
jgi:hypothetical protein